MELRPRSRRARSSIVTAGSQPAPAPIPPKRTGVMGLALSCFLALALVIPSIAAAGVAAQPADVAGYEDLAAEHRDVVAELDEQLSRYVISARLDPATGTISGEQRVTFVNATGGPLDAVYFRLFPNAWYYGEGGLSVSDVTLDGEAAESELAVEETVLGIPLPAVLAAGETVEVGLSFVATVPTDTSGSFGIFSRSSAAGTWVLADWYPILAGWEPDRGWRLDAPTSFGDPTFGATALYDVTISAPEGQHVVTSGQAVGEPEIDRGWATRRYVAGPVRDFTLVMDDDYVSIEAEADGTTVRSFATPGREAAARAALEVAVAGLEIYGEIFGAYPYEELDLVDTPLVNSLGVAWAGLIFLDGPGLYDGTFASNRESFDFIVAHEVAHQWWAVVIGVNSNDHTFLAEGLTNYTAVIWLERAHGPEVAREILAGSVAGPYLALLEGAGDMVADVPIEEGLRGRGALWYGKSALGFHAIRVEIGDSAFFAALADFAAAFAFAIAEPADLLAAFEDAAGRTLDQLWRFWFEAAETTPTDVEALLAA